MADSIVKRLEKLEKLTVGDKKIIVFIQSLDDENIFIQHNAAGGEEKRCTKAELAEISRQHPNDMVIHVTYKDIGMAKDRSEY